MKAPPTPSQDEKGPIARFFMALCGKSGCECGRHDWEISINHNKDTLECFPTIRRCKRVGYNAAELYWAYSMMGLTPNGDKRLGDNKWYPLAYPTYGMNQQEYDAWMRKGSIIPPEEIEELKESMENDVEESGGTQENQDGA